MEIDSALTSLIFHLIFVVDALFILSEKRNKNHQSYK
jgi:hypothetical protein